MVNASDRLRVYEDWDNFGIPGMEIGLERNVPGEYGAPGAEELKEEGGRGWKLEDLLKVQEGREPRAPHSMWPGRFEDITDWRRRQRG